MGGKKQKRSLTVAPFKCAWREELRFKEAGRGCVAFEAFAHNDVTLVFREQAGSQHYHYKTDNSPNYTVILGSHRNRRLKIEVDGKTVVDVAGVGLCSSSAFQSYWIGIYDGLITVGKGKQPFQDTVFQWLDSKPNCNVQYVGLSSWDKHVGYRNVNVLQLTQHNNCLRSHVDYKEYDGGYGEEGELEDASDSFEESGLPDFLESWELSDMIFVVGPEKKVVPAHRVILHAAGTFNFDSSDQNTITLPSVSYLVLRAFLEYIYTGRTEITDAQLGGLRGLSKQFQIHPLTKECEEITDRFKMNKKLFDNGKKVEISFLGSQVPLHAIFPSEFPISPKRLQKFLKVGEHSDIDIYIEGHGLVARSHKVILSLWSVPFAKMFTNGMAESLTSEIHLKDIPIEAFTAMLQYMYSGELDVKEMANPSSFLVPLLLLADQFAVAALHKECCRCLLECLSEDSVCSILLAVSSVFSCKLLEETCKRFFSMHFDYCTTATTDFVMLEEEVFKDIFQDISLEIQSQHPDLTVTSEERVFDAILLWGLQADEICGWETVDKLLKSSTLERLFTERLATVETLLPSVRFPLMPPPLLNKLEESNLCSQSSVLKHLVTEAIQYSNFGTNNLGINENLRFQHRRSSFKELQYICDGDSNGVIYFAGTSYGEHQWVNPVLSKKINVTASSPISRYTDPKVLVSRTYQGTSFAGPRIENGKTCAWWMVDLGQGHQLMCNYYTLRQDGSSAYIRSWALQGSLDGQNWSNLRIHENEHTVCKPGQFSSWPIQGTMALLPFRFFRVLLIAPTTDVSNAWNLCICFIELYGYFR